jgi:hypothetical protein
MKSTMIFFGLFLVGATALRLENNCNVPLDASMACDGKCNVGKADLETKNEHIISFKNNTLRKDQLEVVAKFDRCLAIFVEQRVAEERAQKGHNFLEHIAPRVAYSKVEEFDQAVHQHLAQLAGVTAAKETIDKTRKDIKNLDDCFLSNDNLTKCKTMMKHGRELAERLNKLEKYRSVQSNSITSPATRAFVETERNDIVIRNQELAQWLPHLELVEPTTVCNGYCYQLVLTGSTWPAHSQGRIHGLWYQNQANVLSPEGTSYNPNYYHNAHHDEIPANYGPRGRGDNNWAQNMRNYEWMKHGRHSNLIDNVPNTPRYAKYIHTAESLFDLVNYMKQTIDDEILNKMTKMTGDSDTMYCFKQKPGVGAVDMVLVKCA